MFYFYRSKSFNPFENLATEEYLLDYANKSDDIFILYLWQNENTVVLGRNQDVFSECNLANVDKYSTFIARRKTGGGAVYHDVNNLNFSLIIPKKSFDKIKSMLLIKSAVNKFGVDVQFSGRNDLIIDDKKFSGSAYLNKNNVTLHHGTLLIDTNFEILNSVLSVNKLKLLKNSVKSVKSRVINLKEVVKNITVDELVLALKNSFAEKYNCKFSFPDLDYEKISSLTNFYSDINWIYGDKKFSKAVSYYKEFPFGVVQLKKITTENNTYIKVCSDALDTKLISEIQNHISQLNCSDVDKLFDYVSNITNL